MDLTSWYLTVVGTRIFAMHTQHWYDGPIEIDVSNPGEPQIVGMHSLSAQDPAQGSQNYVVIDGHILDATRLEQLPELLGQSLTLSVPPLSATDPESDFFAGVLDDELTILSLHSGDSILTRRVGSTPSIRDIVLSGERVAFAEGASLFYLTDMACE